MYIYIYIYMYIYIYIYVYIYIYIYIYIYKAFPTLIGKWAKIWKKRIFSPIVETSLRY